jgi:shikimate dehydrogenase
MDLLKALSPPRFVLLGQDVRGSLSPYLHNRALALLGIEGFYEALSLPHANLASLLPKLHAEGIRGINITLPYKESILKYVSSQDDLVKRLGATNTLVWEEQGYRAFNTDAWGFKKSLQALHSLQGSELVVFGAGGAAKAVVEVLLSKKVGSITLINRSFARLEAFKSSFEDESVLKTYLWDDPSLKNLHKLGGLINASGVGGGYPIGFSQVQPSGFVYDLNYSTQGETSWVLAAKEAGLKAQDGRAMLAAQAAKAMSLWLGKDPEGLNELYQSIIQAL